LKYADNRFTQVEAKLAGIPTGRKGSAKPITKHRSAVPAPTKPGRQSLKLEEGANLGKASMTLWPRSRGEPALVGVLPRTYQSLTNDTLVSLLRSVNSILGQIHRRRIRQGLRVLPRQIRRGRGSKGGEYFTPTPIVNSLSRSWSVQREDPRPGVRSGGMFVQKRSVRDEHRNGKTGRLSIHGQERVDETVRLCKMNLAVHGLEGQIKQPTLLRGPLRVGGPV